MSADYVGVLVTFLALGVVGLPAAVVVWAFAEWLSTRAVETEADADPVRMAELRTRNRAVMAQWRFERSARLPTERFDAGTYGRHAAGPDRKRVQP